MTMATIRILPHACKSGAHGCDNQGDGAHFWKILAAESHVSVQVVSAIRVRCLGGYEGHDV